MRINLYGGPCSGKSTTAHFITYDLKAAGLQAEFVGEVIKNRAHRGEDIHPTFDQASITADQLAAERDAISTGAIVVSESPVLLGAVFANSLPASAYWSRVAKELDDAHPALHLFIERGEKPWDPRGRWGTLEDAQRVDGLIRSELEIFPEERVEYLPYGEWDRISSVVRRFVQ